MESMSVLYGKQYSFELKKTFDAIGLLVNTPDLSKEAKIKAIEIELEKHHKDDTASVSIEIKKFVADVQKKKNDLIERVLTGNVGDENAEVCCCTVL